MEIVLAKKYQLARISGKYSTDNKVFLRDVKTVRDYVEEKNATLHTSGIWFEIDEKASKELNAKIESQIKHREEAEKNMKEINVKNLAAALSKSVETTKTK